MVIIIDASLKLREFAGLRFRHARPSFGLTRAGSVGFLRFHRLKRFLDV
jgi:hypothetical protein